MTTPRPRRRRTLAPLPILAAAALLTLVACGGPSGATHRGDPAATETREEPASPELYAHWLAAEMALHRADLETAADRLELALALRPATPSLHARRAEVLLAMNAPDAAMAHVEALDLLDHDPAERAMLRARALDQRGDTEAGLEALARVRDATPPALHELEIRLAQQCGDDEAIDRTTLRFVEAHPTEARAWRLRADALRTLGHTALAVDAALQAAAQPAGVAGDAESALRVALDADDRASAERALEFCLRRYRTHAPCLALGATLADRATPETSDEADRDDPRALPPSVADRLDRLAGLTGGDRFAIARTGALLRQQARTPLVVRYALLVREQRPFNVASIQQAAWVAWSAGDNDTAVDLMESVLALDDANFDALNFIGYDWAERGIHLDRAERYIREALFLRPDDPNIQDSLAWVLYRQERFEEAREVQAAVVEQLPDNATILDHWGDILAATGDLWGAVDAWQLALEHVSPSESELTNTIPPKIEAAREALGERFHTSE